MQRVIHILLNTVVSVALAVILALVFNLVGGNTFPHFLILLVMYSCIGAWCMYSMYSIPFVYGFAIYIFVSYLAIAQYIETIRPWMEMYSIWAALLPFLLIGFIFSEVGRSFSDKSLSSTSKELDA